MTTPPSGFDEPAYSPPPAPPTTPTNTLAIVALVGALVVAPLGIVAGHLSLAQIKRTGERGRALAIAGLAIGYAFTIFLVGALVAGIALYGWLGGDDSSDSEASSYSVPPFSAPDLPAPTQLPTPTAEPTLGALPPFEPPAGLGNNCAYSPTMGQPAKRVTAPAAGPAPTAPATVGASMATSAGSIGLTLDQSKAPCTVHSFVSLIRQGYFDDTACHRLTTSPSLSVLQCGDPAGTGMGGPGYEFADEYPTNQYFVGDAALQVPVMYPRGTLAMANAGPGTNGSQFFLVYQDAQLPPNYTVFGTINETGLATLDKIAAAGVIDGSQDGSPATRVTITSVELN